MTENPVGEKVTATMIFSGVVLGCINNERRYEVGMIKCPQHEPRIEITSNGVETELDWPKGHDLIFKVVNPQEDGVTKLPVDDADERSFRFVVDLEGPLVHDGGVIVDKDLFNGRRIGVTAGKLYTMELLPDDFDLHTWSNLSDPGTFAKEFGKIAKSIGLDISCRPEQGSGIDILDAVTGKSLLWLPSEAESKYQISIDNDCGRLNNPTAPRPAVTLPVGATDFRFFYNVIRPRIEAERKFDFRLRQVEGEPPLPSPDACVGGHAGQTGSIGLIWPGL